MGSSASSTQRPPAQSVQLPNNSTFAYPTNPYQPPYGVQPPYYVQTPLPYPDQNAYPASGPYQGGRPLPPRPPPPASVAFGSNRTTSWTESKDRVLSRILYAEEFLNRINELNARIQLVSQLPDRQRYQPSIVEMLGLCGHLHGELVRIHQMIAAEDPELKCISDFEIPYSHVVYVLRDIQRQADSVRHAASGTDDVTRRTVDSGMETEAAMGTGAGVGTSGHGSTSSSSSIGVQSDSTSRADAETQDSTQRSTADGWTTNDNDFVGTQTTAVEAGNIDEETAEDNLKQKHKQEADAVAERYAQAFVNTNQLSIDEVNRLLNDHAHTVQRLRIRQDAEKQRMNDILAVKRQQRRREKAANGDADHSDEDKESSEAEEAELNKVSDELASYGALQSRIDGALNEAVDSQSNGVTETPSNLAEAVRQLESLRLHGELTEEALSALVSQYMPSVSQQDQQPQPSTSNGTERRRGLRERQDSQMTRESASQLVQQNLAKQKEIQERRQHEKQQLEAKLQQKLREKNQQQQFHRQQVTENEQ